jgi:hypothetical protein
MYFLRIICSSLAVLWWGLEMHDTWSSLTSSYIDFQFLDGKVTDSEENRIGQGTDKLATIVCHGPITEMGGNDQILWDNDCMWLQSNHGYKRNQKMGWEKQSTRWGTRGTRRGEGNCLDSFSSIPSACFLSLSFVSFMHEAQHAQPRAQDEKAQNVTMVYMTWSHWWWLLSRSTSLHSRFDLAFRSYWYTCCYYTHGVAWWYSPWGPLSLLTSCRKHCVRHCDQNKHCSCSSHSRSIC